MMIKKVLFSVLAMLLLVSGCVATKQSGTTTQVPERIRYEQLIYRLKYTDLAVDTKNTRPIFISDGIKIITNDKGEPNISGYITPTVEILFEVVLDSDKEGKEKLAIIDEVIRKRKIRQRYDDILHNIQFSDYTININNVTPIYLYIADPAEVKREIARTENGELVVIGYETQSVIIMFDTPISESNAKAHLNTIEYVKHKMSKKKSQ